MSALAICTTVFPSGLPFFGAYCQGLVNAAQLYSGQVHLVLVSDGLEVSDFADLAQNLRGVTELHIEPLTSGGPAAARRLMLELAAALPVTAVVCYDMDDIPDPSGLSRHMSVLQNADISFGDMNLIDATGRTLDRTFFAGQDIPDRLGDPAPLLYRNFMGFTNTAMKREHIMPMAMSIPNGITAIDWWFYTSLLKQTFNAAKTDGPVVAYRTHGQNIVGSGGIDSDETLLRQCHIMRQHYAHLPPSENIRQADRAVERLVAMSTEARMALRVAAPLPGVWYDEVSRICNRMDRL